jgi:putative methyltransferase (TIGR04325 family)
MKKVLEVLRKTERHWRGAYPHIRDVPGRGGSFNDDSWLKVAREDLQRAMAECDVGAARLANADDMPLLSLAAMAAACSRKVRIVDFGGGLGVSFIRLASRLSDAISIDYLVIETPRLCAEGEHVFSQDPRIAFAPDIPAKVFELDIVYVNSALQYVEDYGTLLGRICALSPRFILLVRCATGDMPTFASAQSIFWKKSIPYWFVNRIELLSAFDALGYEVAAASYSADHVDLSNLPEPFRGGALANFLLTRKGAHPCSAR